MRYQISLFTSLILFSFCAATAQVTITPTNIGINKTALTTLDVDGDMSINEHLLYLRNSGDENHGVGWFNSYGGFTLDGPVLFGFANGALGTNQFGTRKAILRWQENGEVFIPGGDTKNRLQVGGGLSKMSVGSAEGSDLGFGTSYIGFNASRIGANWRFDDDGANNGGAIIYGNVNGDIHFSSEKSTGVSSKIIPDADIFGQIKMTIKNDGRVAIGTQNTPLTLGSYDLTNYKLYVCGGILSNEWLVPNASWCDYVFEDDYKLKTLSEVETYIEENGHLHNTPSAEEIENNGLEVAKMTINQQEKIEELYLHLIEMNKRLDRLEQKNEQLVAENQKLRAATSSTHQNQ